MRALAVLALLAAAAAVPVQHGRRGRQGRAAAAKADAGVASFVLENDVNIVHLTDVHSWLSGHLHEPADEADYPDVLAFFQRLEAMAHAQVCGPPPPPPLFCRTNSQQAACCRCRACAAPADHARASARAVQGKDLFLFNSGDIVDGTGLAGATAIDGQGILPIIRQVCRGHAPCPPCDTRRAAAKQRVRWESLAECALTGCCGVCPLQMPFAAITCGNHELYIDSTIGNMVQVGVCRDHRAASAQFRVRAHRRSLACARAHAQSGFIDSWKGRYIQGNIRNSTTNALLGTPYAHIAGAMGTELVVLGFLYNMWDSCKSVTVQHVELAVKEPWFAEAMAAASDAKVSAIVVLAHMHVEDHLVSVLLKAIRATYIAASAPLPCLFLALLSPLRSCPSPPWPPESSASLTK